MVEGVRRLLYGTEIAALWTQITYHVINPASRLYGKVYSNGNRGRHQIALTFDDGPNEPYTSQVLNILMKYGVKATFFFIGQNAQHYPKVCQRVLAEGNVIGNHSYHHYKSLWLRWGKATVREIDLARQAIHEVTGYQPELFRPPHGFRTPWLMHTIHRLGYTVVTWDNMTNDWKAEKPAKEIVDAIVKRAKSGGIIVLHDGRSTKEGYDRSQMLQALPHIIEEVRKGGFDFVTIPELLQDEAATPLQQF